MSKSKHQDFVNRTILLNYNWMQNIKKKALIGAKQSPSFHTINEKWLIFLLADDIINRVGMKIDISKSEVCA